jgi:chromosome segregation ATPase
VVLFVLVQWEPAMILVCGLLREVAALLDEKKSLTSSLAGATAQCDSLKLSLDSRERELQDTIRHTDVEKRVLLEKIRSLESKDGTTTTRVSELSTELDSLRSQAAVAESDNRHLKAQLEQLQARKALMEEQVS